jgi:hypothetical protein
MTTRSGDAMSHVYFFEPGAVRLSAAMVAPAILPDTATAGADSPEN